MEIFSGLDRAYGIYEITGQKNTAKGIKKDGRGKTLQEPLTLDLWKQQKVYLKDEKYIHYWLWVIRFFSGESHL